MATIRPRSRLVLLVAFFVVSILGCNQASESDNTPGFITSPGTYKYFRGQMTVIIEETQDGGINCTVKRGRTMGVLKACIGKRSAWLIYADTPGTIWTYDGEKHVMSISLSEKGAVTFSWTSVDSDLLQRAPAAFLERLPASMKK